MINVEAKYFLLEYIYMVPHFDSGGRHSVNQNSTEHSRASAWMEWRRHRTIYLTGHLRMDPPCVYQEPPTTILCKKSGENMHIV